MPLPKTCANCGAPLTSGECEYCGTVYVHDRTSAQEAQLMAELQKTVLEIRISRKLEEMNAILKQQNKSFVDRLLGR